MEGFLNRFLDFVTPEGLKKMYKKKHYPLLFLLIVVPLLLTFWYLGELWIEKISVFPSWIICLLFLWNAYSLICVSLAYQEYKDDKKAKEAEEALQKEKKVKDEYDMMIQEICKMIWDKLKLERGKRKESGTTTKIPPFPSDWLFEDLPPHKELNDKAKSEIIKFLINSGNIREIDGLYEPTY